MNKNPHTIFSQWYKEVNQIYNAKFTCLTTVSQSGKPSCKVIQLLNFSEVFIFSLNKESQAELHLKGNSNIALTFQWPLGKMVRIEGLAKKTPLEKYVEEISYNERIAAECGKFSRLFPSYNVLYQSVNKLKEQYPTNSDLIPNVSVYTLLPDRFEFYQGKKGQFQERLQFNKGQIPDDKFIYQADNEWTYTILSP